MNPLLFADWARMNRVFTRVMWLIAVILVCAVCLMLTARHGRANAAATSPSPPAHVAAASAPAAPGDAAPRRGGGAGADTAPH